MKSSRILRWSPLFALVAVTLAFALGVAGCAGDDEDTSRSVVALTKINENVPLFSDLYNHGADATPEATYDDFIPIDEVVVEFTSRPADGTLTMTPSGPFGTVHFTRCTVDFAKNDLNNDGVVDIFDMDNPMNVVVPVGGTADGAVLLVAGGWKTSNYLAYLELTGGEAITSAALTFYGEEETSHDPVVVKGGIVVSFADYADAK